MGRRGPKSKPDALKILEGNPGKRALNHNRPEPRGRPACPAHLSLDAQREWRRIVSALPPGLVTAVDVPLLGAFCEAWALHKEACAHIHVEGAVVDGKQNPWLLIQEKQVKIMAMIGGRFGLSPSDRNNLKAPEPKEKDSKWAGLIG